MSNDKKGNPDCQDDEANRPENNADLEIVVQDQQDHTKHGVPPYTMSLYPQETGFTQAASLLGCDGGFYP
jgi:hypothetical protein